MVSSRSESCPKCGFSVRLSMEQQEETNPQVTPVPDPDTVEQQEKAKPILNNKSGRSSKKGLMAVIVAVAIIVCGGIGWVVYNGKGAITVEITPELTEAVQKYDELGGFNEGLACVKKDGKYGYIDGKGEEVIPCRYDEVDDFSEGLAAVQKDGLCGFINKNGEEVVPCRYDRASSFSDDGLAWVVKGGLWGVINEKGEEVVPCIYDENDGKGGGFIYSFSDDGLAWVRKSGLCGVINKNGEEVIPCRYDYAGGFSEGLAPAQIGSKWGYVDKKGNSTFTQDEIQTAEAKKEQAMAEKAEKEQKEYQKEKTATEQKEYQENNPTRVDEEKPDWLQGVWVMSFDSPYGKIAEYKLVIHGNQIVYSKDGNERYNGNYTYSNGRIKFGNYNYKVDLSRKIIDSDTPFHPFKRISGGSGNSVGNNINFRTSTDVMSYVIGKTFYGTNDIRIKIDWDGIYINGRRQYSGAPQVVSFNSSKAIIKISIIPNGELKFLVQPQNGSIVDMSDGYAYYTK